MFMDYTFRASGNGKLMTEPRTKSELLSETTKTYLLECFIEKVYGRKKDITSKYITKGLEVEEDSITLYSRVKKTFFKKNEERLHNEYLCGTPDLFIGETIDQAEHIIDIKSSWSIHTFFDAKYKALNKDYYWQMQSYMALTGAKSATLAYCLVNTPLILIEDEKRKLGYKMGALTSETPEYVTACEELEKAMTFEDIPIKERVAEFHIERNEQDIQKLYDRVVLCRGYLLSLEPPSVLLATADKETGAVIIQ